MSQLHQRSVDKLRRRSIDRQSIENELTSHGLLAPGQHVEIEPLTGGANTRVYVARIGGGQPALTIRLRERQDRSAAEIEGLSDAGGCPGVPSIRLLTPNLMVHDFLPGAPQDFKSLNDEQVWALGSSLACIHSATSSTYTPWPEQTHRTGSLADLLRFRTRSLVNYASYAEAESGRIHPMLPELLAEVLNPDLSDPSWSGSTFSRLHGDLSRGNILWQDVEMVLIDWEYSRVGDPAEEMAYLLTEQNLDLEAAHPLRRAYREAGGDERTWNRVPAYGLFTAIDSTLWWSDYARTHGIDARRQIEQRIAAALQWRGRNDTSGPSTA